MKRRKILIGILAGLLLICGGVFLTLWGPYLHVPNVTTKQLDSLNLKSCKKLMIVAHPDDEYIWGGAHLLKDDYFVVCITRGNDKVRRKEFFNMLKQTGDQGMILSYPDKIGPKRSTWKFWKKDIEKDIETILQYKDWDQVVTHNQDGEYGHQHHKMTHQLVVQAFDQCKCKGELDQFGTYYRRDQMPEDMKKVDEDVLQKKLSLAYIYDSQQKVVHGLSHMLPYENFTRIR